jgi:hypothetical protein
MPASAFVDLVQSPEIVLDDLRERAFDAGSGQVDQNIDTPQQVVYCVWIAKVAVGYLLGIGQGRERAQPPARAQLDAAL